MITHPKLVALTKRFHNYLRSKGVEKRGENYWYDTDRKVRVADPGKREEVTEERRPAREEEETAEGGGPEDATEPDDFEEEAESAAALAEEAQNDPRTREQLNMAARLWNRAKDAWGWLGKVMQKAGDTFNGVFVGGIERSLSWVNKKIRQIQGAEKPKGPQNRPQEFEFMDSVWEKTGKTVDRDGKQWSEYKDVVQDRTLIMDDAGQMDGDVYQTITQAEVMLWASRGLSKLAGTYSGDTEEAAEDAASEATGIPLLGAVSGLLARAIVWVKDQYRKARGQETSGEKKTREAREKQDLKRRELEKERGGPPKDIGKMQSERFKLQRKVRAIKDEIDKDREDMHDLLGTALSSARINMTDTERQAILDRLGVTAEDLQGGFLDEVVKQRVKERRHRFQHELEQTNAAVEQAFKEEDALKAAGTKSLRRYRVKELPRATEPHGMRELKRKATIHTLHQALSKMIKAVGGKDFPLHLVEEAVDAWLDEEDGPRQAGPLPEKPEVQPSYMHDRASPKRFDSYLKKHGRHVKRSAKGISFTVKE